VPARPFVCAYYIHIHIYYYYYFNDAANAGDYQPGFGVPNGVQAALILSDERCLRAVEGFRVYESCWHARQQNAVGSINLQKSKSIVILFVHARKFGNPRSTAAWRHSTSNSISTLVLITSVVVWDSRCKITVFSLNASRVFYRDDVTGHFGRVVLRHVSIFTRNSSKLVGTDVNMTEGDTRALDVFRAIISRQFTNESRTPGHFKFANKCTSNPSRNDELS